MAQARLKRLRCCLSALVSTVCAACTTFAGEPSTRPTDTVPRPIAVADELRARVLIFPLQVIGGHASHTWLGRSIQQSLLADATIDGPIPAGTGVGYPADVAEAVSAARLAKSRYALFGFVHVNAIGEMRVTAQLIDASTGRPVAALKSTGPTETLFPVEDELAGQLHRALATLINSPAPAPPSATFSEPAPVIAAYGPVQLGNPYQTGPSPIFTPLPPPPPPAMTYRYQFGPAYGIYGFRGNSYSNLYYYPIYSYGPFHRRTYCGGYYPNLTITGGYHNGHFGLGFRTGR